MSDPVGPPAVDPVALTVIGEALVDLTPGGAERSFVARTGGSPFNVAVGAARLGVATALMARMADDPFGRMLRADAAREGLVLGAAPVATERTTLAVVSVDGEAQATYDFYVEGTADWQWTDAEMARAPASRVLHFGSLASWTAPGCERILGLAGRARAGGTLVTYDPNVRPGLLADRRRAVELVDRAVAVAHLVKVSADDLAWLHPGEEPGSVAARWSRRGPSVVVVTDGSRGAVGHLAAGATVTRRGRPVEVVDTIGAGDSFTAALVAGLLEGGLADPASLAGAGADRVATALDLAVLASSLTCGRAGADPPTAADVAAARRGTPA